MKIDIADEFLGHVTIASWTYLCQQQFESPYPLTDNRTFRG